MKALLTIALAMLAATALAQSGAEKAVRKISLYKTADSAACAPDVAVWIDPRTGAYYQKGHALFGKTKGGGYNCRRTSETAGYQPATTR